MPSARTQQEMGPGAHQEARPSSGNGGGGSSSSSGPCGLGVPRSSAADWAAARASAMAMGAGHAASPFKSSHVEPSKPQDPDPDPDAERALALHFMGSEEHAIALGQRRKAQIQAAIQLAAVTALAERLQELHPPPPADAVESRRFVQLVDDDEDEEPAADPTQGPSCAPAGCRGEGAAAAHGADTQAITKTAEAAVATSAGVPPPANAGVPLPAGATGGAAPPAATTSQGHKARVAPPPHHHTAPPFAAPPQGPSSAPGGGRGEAGTAAAPSADTQLLPAGGVAAPQGGQKAHHTLPPTSAPAQARAATPMASPHEHADADAGEDAAGPYADTQAALVTSMETASPAGGTSFSARLQALQPEKCMAAFSLIEELDEVALPRLANPNGSLYGGKMWRAFMTYAGMRLLHPQPGGGTLFGAKVQYRPPRSGLGRYVVQLAGADPDAWTVATMLRESRAWLAASLYHDVDMANAQPSLALQLFTALGIPAPAMAEYVARRERRLQEVMDKCSVGRLSAKELFLRICFGGSCEGWSRDVTSGTIRAAAEAEVSKALPDFPRQLQMELRRNVPELLRRHPLGAAARAAVRPNASRPELSAFAYLCQDAERRCADALLAAVRGSGRAVGAVIYDGLLVRREPGVDADARLDPQLLRGWAAAVEAATGLKVRLEEKTWELNPELVGLRLPASDERIIAAAALAALAPSPSAIQEHLAALGLLQQGCLWLPAPPALPMDLPVAAAARALPQELRGYTRVLEAGYVAALGGQQAADLDSRFSIYALLEAAAGEGAGAAAAKQRKLLGIRPGSLGLCVNGGQAAGYLHGAPCALPSAAVRALHKSIPDGLQWEGVRVGPNAARIDGWRLDAGGGRALACQIEIENPDAPGTCTAKVTGADVKRSPDKKKVAALSESLLAAAREAYGVASHIQHVTVNIFNGPTTVNNITVAATPAQAANAFAAPGPEPRRRRAALQAAPASESVIDQVLLDNWDRDDIGLAEIAHHLLSGVIKLAGTRIYYFNKEHCVWCMATEEKEVRPIFGHALEGALQQLHAGFKRRAQQAEDKTTQETWDSRAAAVAQKIKYVRKQGGVNAVTATAIYKFRDNDFVNELDKYPYLLGVLNGVVDLRTGALRARRPEDLIATVIPVAYDPDADSSDFERLVLDCMAGKADMASFLQLLLGYGITGEVCEEVFVVFTGSGRNGKGVITQTLKKLLGDFYRDMHCGVICDRKVSNLDAERGKLLGARIAVYNELKDGEKIQVDSFQLLSGGDGIPARPLYMDPITVQPRVLNILSTNYLPGFDQVLNSTMERLLIINFPVLFTDLAPGEEPTPTRRQKDSGLKERLLGNLPGVLKWLVQGAMRWYAQRGLKRVAPAEVLAFAATFFEEQDTLLAFINQCCVVDAEARLHNDELLAAYNAWLLKSNQPTVTRQRLINLMRNKGFIKGPVRVPGFTTTVQGFKGIAVRDEEQPADPLGD